MTTLLEIERAIERLPSDQFSKIHDWIVEKDWQTWDAQIVRDSADGKLDFLVDEALREAGSGDTRPIQLDSCGFGSALMGSTTD